MARSPEEAAPGDWAYNGCAGARPLCTRRTTPEPGLNGEAATSERTLMGRGRRCGRPGLGRAGAWHWRAARAAWPLGPERRADPFAARSERARVGFGDCQWGCQHEQGLSGRRSGCGRSGAAPSARVPLTRDRIVSAALEFIDANGLPGLTMRRLGNSSVSRRWRCTATSPARRSSSTRWWSHLVAGVRADEVVLDAPQDGWQDFLQRLAHGVRRMALAHPKAFPLVASRPRRGALAAPAAAQPGVGRDIPVRAPRRGLQRRGRPRGLPRLHQLPPRPPPARGRRPRGRRRPPRRPRRPDRRRPASPSTRRSRGCAGRCPRTTRPSSSRRHSRPCSIA